MMLYLWTKFRTIPFFRCSSRNIRYDLPFSLFKCRCVCVCVLFFFLDCFVCEGSTGQTLTVCSHICQHTEPKHVYMLFKVYQTCWHNPWPIMLVHRRRCSNRPTTSLHSLVCESCTVLTSQAHGLLQIESGKRGWKHCVNLGLLFSPSLHFTSSSGIAAVPHISQMVTVH